MRLATFNIQNGRAADGQVDIDGFASVIAELDADVLGLQEVDRAQPRSHLADFTAVAAEVMGAREHRFVAALAGTAGATWVAASGDEQPGTATYGIALLARYSARSWQVMRLPRIPMRFPMYLPGPNRIKVVREEPRAVVVGEFDTPLGRLTVANTHLSFVPGWNAVQLHRVHRNLAASTDPVILLGDLNMTRPRLPGFRPLAAARTFPADAPTRQLDHVLARGDFARVVDVRTPELPLSDHRALIVDLGE